MEDEVFKVWLWHRTRKWEQLEIISSWIKAQRRRFAVQLLFCVSGINDGELKEREELESATSDEDEGSARRPLVASASV